MSSSRDNKSPATINASAKNEPSERTPLSPVGAYIVRITESPYYSKHQNMVETVRAFSAMLDASESGDQTPLQAFSPEEKERALNMQKRKKSMSFWLSPHAVNSVQVLSVSNEKDTFLLKYSEGNKPQELKFKVVDVGHISVESSADMERLDAFSKKHYEVIESLGITRVSPPVNAAFKKRIEQLSIDSKLDADVKIVQVPDAKNTYLITYENNKSIKFSILDIDGQIFMKSEDIQKFNEFCKKHPQVIDSLQITSLIPTDESKLQASASTAAAPPTPKK